MAGMTRFLSGSGSFAVNATLLLAFEMTQPGVRRVCAVASGPSVVAGLAMPWRPYIDNPGKDDSRADRQARCPGPTAVDDGVRLDAAPLPRDFDPHGFPDTAVFACVRIDPYGRVTAARMIGGPRGRMRARLLATIRRDWRFAVESFGPSEPTWQRVRLTSGEVDEPVYDPPLALL